MFSFDLRVPSFTELSDWWSGWASFSGELSFKLKQLSYYFTVQRSWWTFSSLSHLDFGQSEDTGLSFSMSETVFIYSMDVVVEEMQTLWDEVCRLSFFGGRKEGGRGWWWGPSQTHWSLVVTASLRLNETS